MSATTSIAPARCRLCNASSPSTSRRARACAAARSRGARASDRIPTTTTSGADASSKPRDRRRIARPPRTSSSADEPNASWDDLSGETGLSAQLRTCDALRKNLGAEMFAVDPSMASPDVVYTSQVHEARGAEQYNALMKAWRPLIKRTLLEFTYDVERAFCPEPGVLLVRWRAEWDGAFNPDAAMLDFVETKFPDYDGEEYRKLKKEVDDVRREWTGEREYSVKGITTIKVNDAGKIVTHEDKVMDKAGNMGLGDGGLGSGSGDWSGNGDRVGSESISDGDAQAKRERDEFAVTVFYNALKPPGVGAVSWFFDVLLELEWQYFRRQVGDDTTAIQSKQEFTNTIWTLLFTVVVLPSSIITWAILVALTSGEIAAPGGGDKYDQLIARDNAIERNQRARTGPQIGGLGGGGGGGGADAGLTPELLRSLYGQKIGL